MKITKKNIFKEAKKENLEVLKHTSVDKVKDSYGWTPLHFLAEKGNVPRKWLKKKYPWFQLGDKEITFELIEEILNTSNAE